MKAMVLAAGLGVRMRPLTLLRAKPALPVLGRPLVHWTLDALARAGVKDVAINLHHLPETIVDEVGDGRRFGLRVTYSLEPRILGTAGALRHVRRRFDDEPVLVVNGDILFNFSLERLIARHRASGARATLALKPNPDPRKYGPVVTDRDGRVRSIAGLPRDARGRISLFTGVHVLDPSLLDTLRSGPSDSVRDLYVPALERGERIRGERVSGAWYDFGHPAAYLASQLAMMAKGFGHGRRVRFVDPRARLGSGVRVIASVIGPDATVEEGARIVRSVVWDGVRVGRGAQVSGSVIAADVAASETVRGKVITRMGRARIA